MCGGMSWVVSKAGGGGSTVGVQATCCGCFHTWTSAAGMGLGSRDCIMCMGGLGGRLVPRLHADMEGMTLGSSIMGGGVGGDTTWDGGGVLALPRVLPLELPLWPRHGGFAPHMHL